MLATHDEKVNVVILSSSSFPWGMAAITRVRCLAKGMMAEDMHVEYIGLCGADVQCSTDIDYTVDRKRSGQAYGIKYSYPGGFAVRSRYWLIRRVDDFLGKWATLIKLGFMKFQRKLDVVVIYSRNHKVVLFWSRFLHLIKVPVVLELCEWPLAIADTKNKGFKKAYAFCHDAVLSVDAVIPISSYIEKEVLTIAAAAGKTIPSFKIPILIDVEDTDYSDDSADNNQQPYLLYAGAISYFDIAKLVVDISAELKKDNIQIKIKFTGGGSKNLFDALKEYARDKGVLDNFEFTGFLSDEDLAKLMLGATALLAPLPENLQSTSRFPTKLGFYLASGRPVITNAVGEVTQYLQDNVNAFVASNCQAGMIADKIRTVLGNQSHAKTIGENGKTCAFKNFHFIRAAEGVRSFFESLPDYPTKTTPRE